MKKQGYLPLSIIVTMILCFFFFWAYISFEGYSNVQANEEDDMFKQCFKSVFPVISRGSDVSRSIAEEEVNSDNFFKKIIKNIYPVISGDGTATASSQINRSNYSERKEVPDIPEVEENDETDEGVNYQIISSEKAKLPERVSFDFSKPIVYIYHTHATESYEPVVIDNYHSVDEPGTVREVGERMAQRLESKGVKVIHNKTIHDYPSYNESYRRSLETIKKGLEENKSVKIVIDIHRDAADYKADKQNTIVIDNTKAAKYSIVVGSKNDNYNELKTFANYILYKGNLIYPGLDDGIIEKPYKFNEYVSDYYILLEIGDNENDIKEALKTADCFAEILYSVINDIKK